jgi:raffinose/stachyose/melibiose transport system substrate-binding protein
MTEFTFSRRRFLGMTAMAAAGAGLAACTGVSNDDSGGSSSGGDSGSKTLRLFTYEDASQLDNFKAQIAKFDQQNGTTTTVDNLPGSGAAVYPDKLRTELLGGSGPDVWRIWGGQIGAPYAKAKQAADLAPYYQKFGWDSKINQNAIAGMTFDGVKSGVPFFLAGMGA